MIRFASILTLIALLGLLMMGCSQETNPLQPLQGTTDRGETADLATGDGVTAVTATFYIYVSQASAQPINVHMITDSWIESGVGGVTWNSFGNAYDPTVYGTFSADAIGWYSVDITTLVQGWMNGTNENNGLLLRQPDGSFPSTVFHAREKNENTAYVDLCLESATGTECQIIEVTADAFIAEYDPDKNSGAVELLITGRPDSYAMEKQSLVRFEVPEIPVERGCTRTIGYWKNHAGFGPQDDMVTPLLPVWLGTEDGDKSVHVTDAATAVQIFSQKNDKRRNGIVKLQAQLLGAKLNLASGADGSAVARVIARADAFLAGHEFMDWYNLNWRQKLRVLRWKTRLDRYNNGRIGPGHCQ